MDPSLSCLKILISTLCFCSSPHFFLLNVFFLLGCLNQTFAAAYKNIEGLTVAATFYFSHFVFSTGCSCNSRASVYNHPPPPSNTKNIPSRHFTSEMCLPFLFFRFLLVPYIQNNLTSIRYENQLSPEYKPNYKSDHHHHDHQNLLS